MNSKIRYIPLVVIGAIILSLLAVMPAFGEGEVSFIDPGDIHEDNDGTLEDTTPDEQEYARQGGQVGIFIEDSDLDYPIRRVLVPGADLNATLPSGLERADPQLPLKSGEITLEAYVDPHSNTIHFEATRTIVRKVTTTGGVPGPAPDLPDNTDSPTSVPIKVGSGGNADVPVAVGDYIVIGDETVRKVTKVNEYWTGLEGIKRNRIVKASPSEVTYTDKTGTGTVLEVDRHYAKRLTLAGVNDKGDPLTDVDTMYVVSSALTALPAFKDDYSKLGMADLLFEGAETGTSSLTLSHPVVGSNIAAAAGALAANRLGGSLTGSVASGNDVLLLKVAKTILSREDTKVQFINANYVSLDDDLGGDSDGKYYAVYWSQEKNDTGSEVTVRSQAHTDKVTVVLQETAPNSGEFALLISLSVPPAAPRTPYDYVTRAGMLWLPANERDRITVTHPDSSASVKVETSAPTFSGEGPAHETLTRDSRPEVSAQVLDGDSELDDDNIDVIFAWGGEVYIYKPKDDGDLDSISGGFSLTQRMDGADAPSDDTTIYWWIKAKDNAGNVGYTDAAPTKDDESDLCVPTDVDGTENRESLEDAGCQGYEISFDETAPEIDLVETGRHWDPSLETFESDDKTEYRAEKSDSTSILVSFNDKLDADTISHNDFEVNGSTPLSAEVYNVDEVRSDVGKDGAPSLKGSQQIGDGEARGYVFLTVSELDSDDRPKVELVGSISDAAGNKQTEGKEDNALDRIGPKLTVTLDGGDRPVSNDKITMTITADEDIGRPVVKFAKITSTTAAKSAADKTEVAKQTVHAAGSGALVFKSAREYEATITVPSGDGLYSVHVEAQDAAGGNTGTVGDSDTNKPATGANDEVLIDVSDDTKAILFEGDNSRPKIDVDPNENGLQKEFTIDDPDTFISIDYSSEGNEYYDDSTDDKSRTGDDLDTHGMVEIVSATLDGNDIKDDLTVNEAGNAFLYSAKDLELGKHKLLVRVRDEAGNRDVAAVEATITITERKPYSLKLNPGWNLVSIPGEPMDAAINTVIPAGHPIEVVITRDPFTPGGWLNAIRTGPNRDGPFDGSLKEIIATRAYWFKTEKFTPLEVNIPKQSAGRSQLPPTIMVAKGWNLIPILDPDGDFTLPDEDGYNYFGGRAAGDDVDIIRTFNTITNTWIRVKPEDAEIGKGYWLYTTKAGVIIP